MITDTERLDWLDGFAGRYNAAGSYTRLVQLGRKRFESVAIRYGWHFDMNHNRVALRIQRSGIEPVRLAIDEAISPGARFWPAPDPDRTDAARLDWLDARNQALNEHYSTRYGWYLDRLHPLVGLADADRRGMSIREAIDLAMVEPPPKYAAA